MIYFSIPVFFQNARFVFKNLCAFSLAKQRQVFYHKTTLVLGDCFTMRLENLISAQPIIITLDVDAVLFDQLQRVVDAGFSMVELNGIDMPLLRQVMDHFPLLRVGSGNITTAQQLEDCYHAKAHFVTSPGFLPELVQTAAIYSINYLPGIATFSEAMQAQAMGCQQIRPFPASLSFCSQLNKLFPLLRLFPAEIEREDIKHYLNLPAVAAVSMLNPDVLHVEAV